MSWVIPSIETEQNVAINAIDAAIKEWRAQYLAHLVPADASEIESPSVRDETVQQQSAAGQAALVILRLGGVGDGPVIIDLSGHSNPGHDDTLGTTLESVSIRVQRANA